ncbi:GlxA family transcriptional regulator [Sphingomonas sp. CFBP 8760]|uniref:GlxA family transcriptional regulator n=1 Tax=Sphingomonas sp. CFBP 8760 TaxID=2775282 RepID=UPI0017827C92|nr:helix-turn-helix domain-containing protein [Sphingomonas sp. CFBP 8760]MBD8548888.1 helix-turn-helix domain-containing protein [Sphingomonas sp. CFBP 8760]
MSTVYQPTAHQISGSSDKFRVYYDMFEIAILMYDGAQQAAVLGMTDLLVAADRAAQAMPGDAGSPALVVSHWASVGRGGELARVHASEPCTVTPSICILPPALGGPLDEVDPRVTRWLLDRHAAGAVLASICSGAFVLGATGLFDDRTVTTHWAYEDRLRSRFPRTTVHTDRIIIDDGDLITAGGVMAWTDLCLMIIQRFLGHAIMMEVASGFLIDPPGREQSYYSGFTPHFGHRDDAISKSQHFLHDTEGKIIEVSTLAAKAGLEDRTFLRRFQKATGHTTTEYWQRLRIFNAKAKLRDTGLSIDQVGWEVGYTDPSAFRKVFHRIVGLSPSDYRRRFSARGTIMV